MRAAVARFYWGALGHAENVLDLGCGDGGLGAFKPQDRQLHGLEINPVLVEGLKGYQSASVWDLDQPCALPFDDGTFDAVVAKDILEHLRQPWKTVAEIHRVLKPGGRAMASVICYRGRRVWADYTHVRGFTETTARRLFSDAGFTVERQWRMGGVPGSARLNAIHLVPSLLRFPPCDWLWTSSYEVIAVKPR